MTAAKMQFAPTGAPLRPEGKKYAGHWPPPVYVAQFADGSTHRHSFYSVAGKPYDFARAEAGARWLWRENWPIGTQSRTDLIGGYVEHDGQRFEKTAMVASKVNPVAALINKIGKMDWQEIEAIQAAIDQRLAA
jgi:hypothetical protein